MKTRAIAAVSILAIGVSVACLSQNNSLNNSKALKNPVNFASTIAKRTISTSNVIADYGKLPLSFEENRGQTDSRVKFL